MAKGEGKVKYSSQETVCQFLGEYFINHFNCTIIQAVGKSNITRSNTKTDFQKIKLDIKSFFEKNEKQVRIIYRTCMDKFGSEGPHNLISEKIVPDRLVVFVDFYNENVTSNNIRRIITFTDEEGRELVKKYPLDKSRFSVDKIDLKKLPQKYIFESISDLKLNYRNIY